MVVGKDSPRTRRGVAKQSKSTTNKSKNLKLSTKFDAPEESSARRAHRKVKDKVLQNPNQDPEFTQSSSLNERALKMVKTDEYLHKIKLIKAGNTQIKQMEFIMDGLKIQLPYSGQKVTQGYLKKETAATGMIFSRQFQMRYCILDLTKFLFRYAKAPTEKYTIIHLKDIVDIYIEMDPQTSKKRKENNFFSNLSSKK